MLIRPSKMILSKNYLEKVTNSFMKQILIVDKPELLTSENVNGYAEIYTLFTTDVTEFEGIPIIDIPEITNSTLDNGEKFKELISEINRRHSFEYEVLTADKEQYAVKNYVCSFKDVVEEAQSENNE